MVQNNKVLTVSYGTFSCTLEGFEDSFDTMKAIAEYFRDLASDDRYFGAEPPQPDAEMLTRIAQREISRQVEARTSDGAIHLRAAKAETVDVPITDQPTEAPQPSAKPEAAEITVVPETAATEIAIAETQITETITSDADDSVDLAAVTAAVPPPNETSLPPVQDIAVAEPVDEDTTTGDDSLPAADSIAAKLQRIRAVVAQAPRDEEFSEDQHAVNFIRESAVDIAAAMRMDDEAELTADQDNQEQADIALALDRIDQRQTDTSAAPAQVEAEVEAEAEVETEAEAEVETEVEADTDSLAATSPDVNAEDDSSLFDDLDDDSADADVTGEDANILAEIAKHIAPEAVETEQPDAPSPPLRAKITRVKRAAIDHALQSGALEEIADEPSQDKEETSLSDADEADLLRELAAVEAELLASDLATIETDDTPQDEEVTAEDAPARPTPETPDDDVTRLMATADEKLEDPESSSSRETYDHLRAAMAAAQADRAAGGSTGSGQSDEVYRKDLASVVRPRRPAAAKTGSPRPTPAERPAPLKLVAEQRIDEEPVQSKGPVRPRRVASSQVDDAAFAVKGHEGGFAAYAIKSGAVELHELLEAAASYMSFVEGRDHFSRPQLMNKVKTLDSAEFNREDGLRSFGQLLREGKIEKTNSGRFTVSGQIGFRPSERAAS